MINVNPTPEQIKNIKRHKRLFEKWDMWKFAFFYKGQHYFIVDYAKLNNKVSGYLIMDKAGEVLSLEEAKLPAYYLLLFNTMANNAGRGMAIQAKKEPLTYKEMNRILLDNQEKLLTEYPHMVQVINRIVEHNEKVIERPKRIKEIIYNLGYMQREVTRNIGYFDIPFMDSFEDEYGKYSAMMYTIAKNEISLERDYEELKKVMSNETIFSSKKDKNTLQTLLNDWLKTNDTLRKSIATFELDERGNKLQIDERNIKQSLSKNREDIGKRDFENKIVPVLRNPK
ncbi:hypothetical protein MKX67_02800 [Cytobacillus sp. FSL W7-1323]|uniref:hypothetical protein n=1 Tax=unclassified Cytobacillus TaxID=2675268 RepID=UPI002AFEEBEE|nr:hypothetical protein [Cytobacillus sp. OWB-43]MEA1855523.1 hypothetical protein [Cytobacillus sp. OWB-43]